MRSESQLSIAGMVWTSDPLGEPHILDARRVHHSYETLIYLSYRRSAGLRHLNCNGSCGGLSEAGKRRGACRCAPLWPAFAAAQVGELIKSTKKAKSKKKGVAARDGPVGLGWCCSEIKEFVVGLK